MEVVVLGCGPSSSVPSMRCIVNKRCDVCQEANANPLSKNRRLNPCLLVRNLKNGTNLLIDCGKTFREAALRFFPTIGVEAVHALVLTHDHADALLGMDDLREVQAMVETIDPLTKEVYKVPSVAMKVHCSKRTSHDVMAKFPYLIDTKPSTVPIETIPKPFRWTAKLQIDTFCAWKSFQSCGLTFLPFPVIHGAGYTSFGFEFGHEVSVRFIYISDVSEIPEETQKFLHDVHKPRIDVLLIDALYLDKYHSTHMSVQQVIQEFASLKPKRILFTGMSHEFDYPKHSVELPQLGTIQGLHLEMTYDGLSIAFS